MTHEQQWLDTRKMAPRSFTKSWDKALKLLLSVAVLAWGALASAQVCNIKVVTDASPDYSDMDSLIHSITSKWETPKEKCWALYYWHHINRRQMTPMWLHGMELTDPIMQWNDYGYTMCSTICGINCSVWGAMGFKVRHWEIQSHTVPEVFYDNRWHMYDNSMSAIYTLCDGQTIAGTADIGKTQGCAASGGKVEFGHIAKYHCLNGTGKNGLLTGADCNRELHQEGICFNPNKIRNCNDLWWDRGHRYSLTLRPGEAYTRFYHRLGEGNAYYVPNPNRNHRDPDHNPTYKIRGNGVRTWKPDLQKLENSAYAMGNVQVLAEIGKGTGDVVQVQPTKASQVGYVIFKIEGASVITSLNIAANLYRKSGQDMARILVGSPFDKPHLWKEVWEARRTGWEAIDINLADSVNGAYVVLVKVELTGQAAAADAALGSIAFRTITQVNSKALPRFNLGQNQVYVGTGDQSEAVVFWPDLQGTDYKCYVVAEQNIQTEKEHPQVRAVMHLKQPKQEGFVVFKLETPREMTRVVYGGRFFNKGAGSKISLLHSFDNGKTWSSDYTLEGNTPPWDVIHYVTVEQVPAKTRSALFKYAFVSQDAEANSCGLFNVRMEADYRPAEEGFRPLEVTWTWNERQEDYSLIKRSHMQLIEKVPFSYQVNVGGPDHPEMESVQINLKGADGRKYGYSSGQETQAARYVPFWAAYGTNFAEGKPYTLSIPSATEYQAGDKEGERKLTDGIAWCAYGGGLAYSYGGYWHHPKDLRITVDLERAQQCGAFRVHVHGYPWHDAMKGQMPDQVEVLTSADNQTFTSRGFFNLKLRWKDLPVNFMWPDSEEFQGHMFDLRLPQPVEARYVQFKVSSPRSVAITEVQALDYIDYKPFDLRVALPTATGQSRTTATSSLK